MLPSAYIQCCRDRLNALPYERHLYHKSDRVVPDERAQPAEHPRLARLLWNSSWWREMRVSEAIELRYDAQVGQAMPDCGDFLHGWRISQARSVSLQMQNSQSMLVAEGVITDPDKRMQHAGIQAQVAGAVGSELSCGINYEYPTRSWSSQLQVLTASRTH